MARSCLGSWRSFQLLSQRVAHHQAQGLRRMTRIGIGKEQPLAAGTQNPGVQRVRFRLQRDGGGWRIVGIDAPQPLPTVIPYGTHISKVP